MSSQTKFEIVKRKVETNYENTGLDLYILGYVMRGGVERPLLRAENKAGAVLDVYGRDGEDHGLVEIKNSEAFKRIVREHGNFAGRLLEKCYCEAESLTDIIMDMDEQFANAVAIAEDVKCFGYGCISEEEKREGKTSVREHMSPVNPYNLKVENKIESYKEIYGGEFYDIVNVTDEEHVSISDMGNFDDGDIALFHAEDGSGAYLDWLFPSMKTVGKQGESKKLDNLVRIAKKMKSSSIESLLRRRAKDKIDWETNRDEYMSRRWCELYSDRELMGRCSGVHHDVDGDHVYVEAEFNDGPESYELIIRLPECEIVEVWALDNPKEFDVNSLKTECVGHILQRLALATDTIFEIARKMADPNATEDDMNALRDRIDGKIFRSMPVTCPYCHGNLMGEQVHYIVHIPVKFYMHSGNFGVFEDEVYQSVTEAVEAGKVEGVCELCGHTITAEDINKVKDGWKYTWRYDPHM